MFTAETESTTMRNPFFATSIACMAALCGTAAVAATPSENSPAKVWVEGDALYYYGDISSFSVVEDALSGVDANTLNRIVINSGGGDTRLGRELGLWVHEHGLDVEVDAACFSSCANYVFPAGDNKTIREGAFVGWHGNERQFDFLTAEGETPEELIRTEITAAVEQGYPDLSAEERAERIEAEFEAVLQSRRGDLAFFQTLGLSDEFSLYGLLRENQDTFFASGKVGWTFSVADMGRLGLQNVTYLGTSPYHEAPEVLEHLMVFGIGSASESTLLSAMQVYDASIESDHYRYATSDLNGDGCDDAMALMNFDSGYCGNAGCSLLVAICEGDGFNVISNTTIVRPPVAVSRSKGNGYRDIIVDIAGGGGQARTVALRYDGSAYPINASNSEAVERHETDEILIDAIE